MKVSDFGFHLPESLIALRPVTPRDDCRLLVLRRDGSIEHKKFFQLPEYLSEGDLLLLNKTKVFPARITGTKNTGGRIEFLLVREVEPGIWEALCRQKYIGIIHICSGLSAEMLPGKKVRFMVSYDGCDAGTRSGQEGIAKPVRHNGIRLNEFLWKVGTMPLPPYIKRKPDQADTSSYQTVYAETVGSIAAPTAGLHFTEGLIAKLAGNGVIVRSLTLHIGTGTFKPLRVNEVEDHHMDPESFEIDRSVLEAVEKTKKAGKRIVSVGTTTTRAIEGFFSGVFRKKIMETVQSCGAVPSREKIGGSTDIFIYPGYKFHVVDSLITNFHLPESTPLMLTSALCGQERLMDAYSSAIAEKYRFFSYGDAMLIL